ncbi:hypothetical protein AMJ39_07755 [candidate division TA06 bacterium DG_24]|uniref:Photosynthesis system II assembly factor Ycf48/Hcf136-like domain-containing protein n=3 Tax=Bacteria division TA06 TaxID=1156500 RepID=A0A0S8JPK8_UNCT6|nr:MAG: hypothetical protein AMJ39_07755 [candidate division TA06 bacterium DG_24]KPK70283.1 MAG: hypothetical protein AMJ82_03480 [candidate division TA06 bacterium SM23_40]KPL10748.1 MAG: hypothetical protein AMJ71_02035 [candidate division TA06 bacterium SM1_40]
MRTLKMTGILVVAVFLVLGTCGASENEWTYLGLAADSVQCVAVDLTNSQIVYVGALTGCWKTTDGGSSWSRPCEYDFPFKELVMDPDVPDGVWGIWGLGSWSDGVWVTTNGGLDWNVSHWMYCGDALAMCAGNHDVLYAASWNPDPPYASGGIWRTTNHGSQWYGDWLDQYSFRCVAVHPSDPDVAYAGCDGGTLFKTENGGGLWTPLPITSLPVRSLGIDSFEPNTVYAAIGAGSYSDGIYKTLDGGASWDVALWWYKASALALEWENPEVIYAGSDEAGVARSLDGGVFWEVINEGLTNQDLEYIAIDPSDRRAVYAATGGGVFRYEWEPAVGISLEPDSTLIHGGGTLSFRVSLCNHTDEWQTFWLLAHAFLPGGGSVPVERPVRMTMPPQTCRSVHPDLPVPMAAPIGEYRFRTYLGTPPSDAWDVASFRFTIAP